MARKAATKKTATKNTATKKTTPAARKPPPKKAVQFLVLNESWRIEVQTHGVKLEQRVTVESPNTGRKSKKWQRVGYYSSAPAALVQLPEALLRDPDIVNYKIFTERLEQFAYSLDGFKQWSDKHAAVTIAEPETDLDLDLDLDLDADDLDLEL